MAFITLEDRTGRQEVAIFSDIYNQKRESLVKDNLVVVLGEVDVDEYSGGFRMRCQELYDWESAYARSIKNLTLEVQSLAVNSSFSEKLMWTLKDSLVKPGVEVGSSVRILYVKDKAQSVVSLGDQWRVKASKALIEKLKGLEGCEGVLVEYR